MSKKNSKDSLLPKAAMLFGIGLVLGVLASTFVYLGSPTGLPVVESEVTRSPAACSGAWSGCSEANRNGGKEATATVTNNQNKNGTWQRYGFAINNNSVITGVTVSVDASGSTNAARMGVRASQDNGRSWGPLHIVTPDQNAATLIDVTGDRIWTGTRLGNNYFKVQATCYSNDGTRTTCRLDWLPVAVEYQVTK